MMWILGPVLWPRLGYCNFWDVKIFTSESVTVKPAMCIFRKCVLTFKVVGALLAVCRHRLARFGVQQRIHVPIIGMHEETGGSEDCIFSCGKRLLSGCQYSAYNSKRFVCMWRGLTWEPNCTYRRPPPPLVVVPARGKRPL